MTALDPRLALIAWFLSLPVGAALLAGYVLTARRRLHQFDRRAGYLPRPGRRSLPASGRTTLYRVEYGSRDEDLCLMLTRWHHGSVGWTRVVAEHVWVPTEDPVRIGEERARLQAAAEDLEEQMDDARLAGNGERRLIDEHLAERRASSRQARELAEELAGD